MNPQLQGIQMSLDLVERLKTRAAIRRQIATRKSVQEGKPDRIADLLEEAAQALTQMARVVDNTDSKKFDSSRACPDFGRCNCSKGHCEHGLHT